MSVVSMSNKEFARLDVLLGLEAKRIRIADACTLLGLKRRQVFRLLRAYRDSKLSPYVIVCLEQAGSPDQISRYLRYRGGARIRVCHETIYQLVYSASGRELGLFRHLPSARRHRRVR